MAFFLKCNLNQKNLVHCSKGGKRGLVNLNIYFPDFIVAVSIGLSIKLCSFYSPDYDYSHGG